MRIIFATNDLRLPADLTAGFAEVEITGVFGSYAEVLVAVSSAPSHAVIECVILAADLDSPRDREAKLDLEAVLERLRSLPGGHRLVVTTALAQPIAAVQRFGAEQFISLDPTRSAANLAALLGLTSRSEVAKIIAVTGLQGGAGRTTLAQAMAASLGAHIESRPGRGGVLLWELDLKHPTIAFNQEIDLVSAHHGRRTVARLLNADLVEGDDGMRIINSAILSNDTTHLGYDLLLAPHGLREVLALYQAYPNLIELYNRLSKILEILSRHYQVLILDTGTDIVGDPGPAVALSHATAVCVVATASPAGLSSVMGMRVPISDRHISDRSRLVINRVRRDDAAYQRYMQTQAGEVIPLLAIIPDGAPEAAFAQLGSKLLELGG